MAIKNPHDLLVYDLAATYYSERTMLKGMNDMLKLAQSDRVKQMISNRFPSNLALWHKKTPGSLGQLVCHWKE